MGKKLYSATSFQVSIAYVKKTSLPRWLDECLLQIRCFAMMSSRNVKKNDEFHRSFDAKISNYHISILQIILFSSLFFSILNLMNAQRKTCVVLFPI